MYRRLYCKFAWALGLVLLFAANGHADDALYKSGGKIESRWSTFENLNSVRGAGGKANNGGKGHAWETLAAGEVKTLLDVEGSGMVRRMWLTLRTRDPFMLRALVLKMYWDGAETPAVSAPLGDFFGAILGRTTTFENELFSSPEGRSFNFVIPMPFRTGARVTLSNDAEKRVQDVYFEIDYTMGDEHGDDVLYFHAYWHRVRWTTLGQDFEILPKVTGDGRYLGAHVGMIEHPDNKGWWGEGEVKVYLDGDGAWPTLVGTGTEDYIGTAYGQGVYANRYQGSLIEDKEKRHHTFYRYHIPDPVYFHKECRVTIQQMGGATKPVVWDLMKRGIAVKPMDILTGKPDGHFLMNEMDRPPKLSERKVPGGWTNHLRQDDWSAVAFFYLDSPENGLPEIAAIETRTIGLR